MSKKRMPVIFMGHGSPMNAIEDNKFSLAWQKIASTLPEPKAILCVSAHWETENTRVTAMEHPKTIHDFYGFPRELNEITYPAPGSPALANWIVNLLGADKVAPDQKWGLDHGAWSVLARMYPQANIPVLQLSLAQTRDGQTHYDLAKQLLDLRDEGVLILGSGNIVHNLGMVQFADIAYDWALDFDKQVKEYIEKREHEPLIHFQQLGRTAALAINSAEHYLPLLYVLGLQQPDETVKFYCEKVWGGSLSMRCVQIG